MSVQVFDEFVDLVSQPLLVRVSEAALKAGGVVLAASVSVAVANDEVVRDLNARHRGLDEQTDVLSFSYTHHGQFYGDASSRPNRDYDFEFAAPGEEDSIGEVIVSYPQAERQAGKASHSVERELASLVIHGVLHLLGYDHEDPSERAEMEGLERGALELSGTVSTAQ